MNTTEGNKLIAEFMGMTSMTMQEFEEYESDHKDQIHFSDGKPNYDLSWDWLMPVINKCTQVGFRDQDEENEFTEKWDELIADNTGMFVGAHLDEVWRSAIQFIQWYNENK